MNKTKVAVLFGGMSSEHEISCVSAYYVIKGLDKNKYEVFPIGLSKNGDWTYFGGDIEDIKTGKWAESVTTNGTDLANGLFIIRECDVVFPVLHGQNGEDGTVQGLLELLKKPYVGCGVLASASSMDKACTKAIVSGTNVPQCKYIIAYREELLKDKNFYDDVVAEKLGFPCFVKPANAGSSVGVYKVNSKAELGDILQQAQKYDRKTMIEEFVKGREIECAVLGNYIPKAATPGEIKPSKEFYDYEDKYKSGASVSIIPAQIPEEALNKIKEYAKTVFKALDCSGLSRVDFFYQDETGKIVFNEINTLPGFTEISMYAKMWANEGISFAELLDTLIALAFDRKKETTREGI